MTIQNLLKKSGLPVAYGFFREKKEPPFVVYTGAGQRHASADNTFYHSENEYKIEYYFLKKDETAEGKLEQALLDGGFLFTKSDDTYIDSEDVWVIYYNV